MVQRRMDALVIPPRLDGARGLENPRIRNPLLGARKGLCSLTRGRYRFEMMK